MFPVERQHRSFYTIPVKRAHLFSHPQYYCSGFISGGLCFRLRMDKKESFSPGSEVSFNWFSSLNELSSIRLLEYSCEPLLPKFSLPSSTCNLFSDTLSSHFSYLFFYATA